MGALGAADRDPQELALATASVRHKAALVSLLHGLEELRRGADPGPLVSEIADVWQHRLCAHERGFLLMVGARAAEPDNLDALAMAVLDRAGPPIPPFNNMQAEARLWAAEASPAERRAYAAAIRDRMSERERAAFFAATRKVPA
jgi:hypothetical protein